MGAEVAATVSDKDALDGGATDRAQPTTKVMGNLKLKVGCSQCAIRPKVVFHTGSLVTDGGP